MLILHEGSGPHSVSDFLAVASPILLSLLSFYDPTIGVLQVKSFTHVCVYVSDLIKMVRNG